MKLVSFIGILGTYMPPKIFFMKGNVSLNELHFQKLSACS